jgi:hypothetical protein
MATANFGFQRFDVRPLQLAIEQTTVEVAVAANGLAERNVRVQANHAIYNSKFRVLLAALAVMMLFNFAL